MAMLLTCLVATVLTVGACGASSMRHAPAHSAHPPLATAAIGSPRSPYKYMRGRCAATDAGLTRVGLRSARPGSLSELVPPGATTLMVCRYNGENPGAGAPPWGLIDAGHSDDAAQVRAVADKLDAVKPVTGNATYNCGVEDGSELLAFFGYRSGPVNPVVIDVSGCGGFGNGHISRMGVGAGAGAVGPLLDMAKNARKIPRATLTGSIAGCTATTGRGVPSCVYPGEVWVTQDGASVGTGWLRRGRFRVQLAVSGPVQLTLREGQINATIATKATDLRFGRSTHVTLGPAPLGQLTAVIHDAHPSGQGQQSTPTPAQAARIVVQTPSQHGRKNTMLMWLKGPRFSFPLPPGHYRLTLFNARYHPVVREPITVHAHRVTRSVLTIP